MQPFYLVEKMLADKQINITQVIGNSSILKEINASDYVTDEHGLPSINDILSELEKPGRDPRAEFKVVLFKEGVESITDLYVDLELEGVVSNVTNFGAFVDIGVHQDGLVHISSMSEGFVSDPRTVVKAGDIVKVKVVEVDKDRGRIGLTMKLNTKPNSQNDSQKSNQKSKCHSTSSKDNKVDRVTPISQKSRASKNRTESRGTALKKNKPKHEAASTKVVFNTAMADALSKLKKG